MRGAGVLVLKLWMGRHKAGVRRLKTRPKRTNSILNMVFIIGQEGNLLSLFL